MKPTSRDLEDIRSAALKYLRNTQHEFQTTFVPELERGAIVANGKDARIGIWAFEESDGQFLLIRQPPISQTMRYFGLVLKRKQNDWNVESDFQEIEKLDLQDKE
jgi:hypothetical protein